jgi:hypothetical protein
MHHRRFGFIGGMASFFNFSIGDSMSYFSYYVLEG